jgi:hypothetical protein
VLSAGNGGETFTAKVTSVFPFVDPGARTAVVEAVVENGARRLFPGQYVQMQFVTGERPKALSVAREALVRLGDTTSVWVVNEGKAERREVATGLTSGERVEIVAGLDEGEQVVRQGHAGLFVGALVADASAAATPATERAGQSPGRGSPGVSSAAGQRAPASSPSHSGHGGQAVDTTVAQATPSAAALQIALASTTITLSSGRGTVRVVVKDAAGSPVSDAKVEVNAGMTGMRTPKTVARASKEPGAYEANVNFGMAGAWTLDVTATPAQGAPTARTFQVETK